MRASQHPISQPTGQSSSQMRSSDSVLGTGRIPSGDRGESPTPNLRLAPHSQAAAAAALTSVALAVAPAAQAAQEVLMVAEVSRLRVSVWVVSCPLLCNNK
jgi:hypothetical protein